MTEYILSTQKIYNIEKLEIWAEINGTDGKYSVSNLGRVKKSDGTLVNIVNSRYRQVRMLGKNSYVHRLVAIHFIPNPENKRTVNHIDGIKYNNFVDNLEWATYSENEVHAWDTGLKKVSQNTINALIKRSIGNQIGCKIVLDLETGIFFNSTIEVSKCYNINKHTLQEWLRGLRKKRKRFTYI